MNLLKQATLQGHIKAPADAALPRRCLRIQCTGFDAADDYTSMHAPPRVLFDLFLKGLEVNR
jgi:hypothetical protein